MKWMASALLLFLLCVSTRVSADERILSFHSDIQIAADATMAVTETIVVNAQGRRIQRGIYRDFPTAYKDRHGRRVNVVFEPLEVTRDGEKEDWRIERLSNGVRVYFGNADRFLEHGEHRYEFRYRSARQLGFFDQHDELYWNITGNGWEFDIDHASASITLPQAMESESLTIEGYTGPQGSNNRDYLAEIDADGTATIQTRSSLGPNEGLTLVLMFPKNIVVEPSLSQQWDWFAADNQREAVLATGLAILVSFLFIQWFRVGRDPAKGVIMPLYDPPSAISPAAARFIRGMSYDDRCFAADLIELGVRGAIRIHPFGSSYIVERTNATWHSVSDSARELYAHLLTDRERISLESAEHEMIGKARSAHDAYLEKHFAKANFERNSGIGCFGFFVSAFFLIVAFLVDDFPVSDEEVICTVLTIVASIFVASSGSRLIQKYRNGASIKGTLAGVVASLLGMIIFGIFLASYTSVVFVLLLGLMCIVQILFSQWMKAYTVTGRKILDQIEGLRLYLGVAERDDLARSKAPPMTVDEYQRLLPYALALEVEQTWGDHLAEAMGPAAVAAAASGLAWYAGSDRGTFDAASFGSALGSSLSSAITSSASPPGSSSGGGGGGSSGGGGGGGGGGGW